MLSRICTAIPFQAQFQRNERVMGAMVTISKGIRPSESIIHSYLRDQWFVYGVNEIVL